MDSIVKGTVVFGAAGVTNTTVTLPTPSEGYVWEVSAMALASSGAGLVAMCSGNASFAPATAAAVAAGMASNGNLMSGQAIAYNVLNGQFPATGPRCVASTVVLSIYAGAACTVAYEIGIKRRRLTQDILNTMSAYTT